MNNINLFTEELEKKLMKHKNKRDYLESETMMDEMKFELVRINIVEIFTKMFSISLKKSNGEKENLIKTYKGFLRNIPRNWENNLKYAQSVDDFESVLIEEIKLETRNQIAAIFDRLIPENENK